MTKTMTKPAFAITAMLLAGLVMAPACLVRGQGVAERVGEALDNAGRGIRNGVQNAFAKTRTSVHQQEVVARVYSRLHWDKVLVGSTLELEVRDGGVTILRGAVADEDARRRAVVLARDTVGVTQVVDELTVPPPRRAWFRPPRRPPWSLPRRPPPRRLSWNRDRPVDRRKGSTRPNSNGPPLFRRKEEWRPVSFVSPSTAGEPVRQKASPLMTSPPWTVLRPRQLKGLIESLTNRTLPSPSRTLTPPGW